MKKIVLSAVASLGIVLQFTGALEAKPLARNAGVGPLVFSEQLLPLDESGAVVSPGDAFAQIKFLLARAGDLLRIHGAELDQAARLHFYVVSPEVEAEARKVTGKIFPDTPVTWVVTPLPHSGALIGMDVVAPTDNRVAPQPKAAAILPSGVRYFISGQAVRDEDLAVATRGTMEQLRDTLEQYGRSIGDAVQIKSFLKPMSEAAAARKEIESFFPEGKTPPLVFVEWESGLPIEIELVAVGGEAKGDAPPVEYLTPEGMKPSPVYCKVARVNDAPLVFVSGLNGAVDKAPADQVRGIFAGLKGLLEKEASDLRHLVKATYYVANPEVSKALNELRPEYYDPERPPAASKAMVAGGGSGSGSGITVDMIAVKP